MGRTDLLVLIASASVAVLARPAVAKAAAPGAPPAQAIQEVMVTANGRVLQREPARAGAEARSSRLEKVRS